MRTRRGQHDRWPLARMLVWSGIVIMVVQGAQLLVRGGWSQEWLAATWTATFGVVLTAPLAAMLAWRVTADLAAVRSLVRHGRRRPAVVTVLWAGLVLTGVAAVAASVVGAWAVVAISGGIAAQWDGILLVAWIPAALVVAVAMSAGHLVGRRWTAWQLGVLVATSVFASLILGYIRLPGVFRVGGISASSVGLELTWSGQLLQIVAWLTVVAFMIAIACRSQVGAIICVVVLVAMTGLSNSALLVRKVPVALECSDTTVQVCVPPQYVDEASARLVPTVTAAATAMTAAGLKVPSRVLWTTDGTAVSEPGAIGITREVLADPFGVASSMVDPNVAAACHDVVYGPDSTKQLDEANAIVSQWTIQMAGEVIEGPSPARDAMLSGTNTPISDAQMRTALGQLGDCAT